jgi:hypothetical protein
MDGQPSYFVSVYRRGGIIVFGRRKVIVRIYVHRSCTGQQLFTVLSCILLLFKKYVRLKRAVSCSGRLAHCPRPRPRLPLTLHTHLRLLTAPP